LLGWWREFLRTVSCLRTPGLFTFAESTAVTK
jgi:hypothetical protein